MNQSVHMISYLSLEYFFVDRLYLEQLSRQMLFPIANQRTSPVYVTCA